jgi:hypothetical protein
VVGRLLTEAGWEQRWSGGSPQRRVLRGGSQDNSVPCFVAPDGPF